MNPLICLKKATPSFVVPFVLTCFALSPQAQAVVPPPDGGYAGDNTAEGNGALNSLTFGINNTAVGYQALFSDTGGSEVHFGSFNTAIGSQALHSNTLGVANTAIGNSALFSTTNGGFNTATGGNALLSNTVGYQNTATGSDALSSNTNGKFNTATGSTALFHNIDGSDNTANGYEALLNSTGSNNIALGFSAGINLTSGSNNIDIGASGVAGESGSIRIGTNGTQTKTFIAGIFGAPITGSTVVVNSNGRLGVATSSARFKEGIQPMDKVSEAILKLKPVSFRYKEEVDPDATAQFGLVAEEVQKVAPDLVIHDEDGKPFTVRYDAVNAMLLNEFLREHRQVQEQGATIAELKSIAAKQEIINAQQQREIKGLAATLSEQASKIQKVSAQLELEKASAQTVVNNR